MNKFTFVFKFITSTILYVFISVAVLLAQSGTLTGQITDASTGEPLGGATIGVENTDIGVTTDFTYGQYTLRNVPAGEQNIVFRFIGYTSQTHTVIIEEGETTELNIELLPDVMEGEEVMVSAQALGQAQAIQRQLNASSIVNVVSEARIRDLADANAAESVGRLPGISVIRDGGEGSQVAIRGLAPQYNAISVDGVRLTGTDAETRAVDLNMISQEMLTGIEVYKSNRPDMDADAIGGTVNFSLASAPEESRYRFGLKGGYNNHVQEAGNYGLSFSGSNRFLDNQLGVFVSIDYERNDRSSDVLTGDFQVDRDAREGEEFAPISMRNGRLEERFDTRNRTGLTVNLDYNIPNGTIYISNFFNRLDRHDIRLTRGMNVDEFRQDWWIRDREVQVDVLSNRIRGEHNLFSERLLFEWYVNRSVSSRTHPFEHRLRFEEHGAFDDTIIDEAAGIRGILPAARNNFNNSLWFRSEHWDNDLREREYTSQMDITVPFQAGGVVNGNVKFGGKYVNKERERTYNLSELLRWDTQEMGQLFQVLDEAGVLTDSLMYTASGQPSMASFLDHGHQNNQFLNGQFSDLDPFPFGLRRDLVRLIGEEYMEYHIPRARAVFNDNGATEEVYAAYIMSELHIGDRLMIMPGIRYEQTDAEYRAFRGNISDPRTPIDAVTVEDTTGTRQESNFFPMVQARFNVTDWFDIRAAYTQSTSRPSFGQLVPRFAANSDARTLSRGHPELKSLISTNYDLFLTFNSNRLGLLTLGGFYKNIDNLIYERSVVALEPEEMGLPPTMNFYTVTEPANNEEETLVYGAEIEWQSNFIRYPRPFNGLIINANLTRVWSETHFPGSELVRGPEGFVRVDTTRVAEMPYQPDWVANVAVGYEYRGFSSRVSVNYQGQTLTLVGTRRETDRFSEDYISWDFAVRQRFTDMISMYANLYNITNTAEKARQFTGQYITDEEYYNWTAEIGIRFEFW
jgi:TonB-dependent receptor